MSAAASFHRGGGATKPARPRVPKNTTASPRGSSLEFGSFAPTRRRRRGVRPPVFSAGQADPLHPETELALLLGRGCHGTPVELQTLDDWRRVWGSYRDVVEPKRREYLPGRRAFAAYVVGELEPRPLLREPPMSHRFFRLWIGGTGRFWTDYPEPFQRDELAWLVDIGACDPDEYRQAVEQRAAPGGPKHYGSVWEMIGRDYPLEMGRFL